MTSTGDLELRFYKTTMQPGEWHLFFKKVLSRKTRIVELSTVLPIKKIGLCIRKTKNQLRFYLKAGKEVTALNSVLYPMQIETFLKETPQETDAKGLGMPIMITNTHNLLDFLIEEAVEEMDLEIRPLFGTFFATGVVRTVDSKRMILMKDASSFLRFNLPEHPGFYIEEIKPKPKSVSIFSQKPILENDNTRIGVENFDVFRHGLIVGGSGSGKSKFGYMLIKNILDKHPDAKIVIIDPHTEFSRMFSQGNVQAVLVDFKEVYIEPLAVGQEKTPQATQLLVELLFSIMGERNRHAERVLFYSIHLLSSLGKLNFLNLGLLLNDPVKRTEFVLNSQNDEIRRFFSSEYQEIYSKHFSQAVLPVLNFIGEYRMYIGEHGEKNRNLLELIEKNRLVIMSFDPNFMGRKMLRFLGGAMIQLMYTLAVTGKFKKPVILLVDEVPLVVNPTLIGILSESRKFGLYLYLCMQYLNQLEKDVLDSIITNCFNIFAFKVNREDATILSKMMDIKLDDVFLKGLSKEDIPEMKKDLFLKLEDRDVIARLYSGSAFVPPVKVRTVEVKGWM